MEMAPPVLLHVSSNNTQYYVSDFLQFSGKTYTSEARVHPVSLHKLKISREIVSSSVPMQTF